MAMTKLITNIRIAEHVRLPVGDLQGEGGTGDWDSVEELSDDSEDT